MIKVNQATIEIAPVSGFTRPAFQPAPIVDYPRLGERRATLCVILTTLLMTYSSLFGFAPILVFYAMWLPLIRYRGKFTLRLTPDIWALALLAGWVVMSAGWSDYRTVTLKAGLEYASMLACTVIIARLVSVEALIKGVTIGLFCALLVLYRKGSFAWEGLFGSKNVAGSLAELGIIFALYYLYSGKRRPLKTLFGLALLALGLLSLALSHSATSLTSLAGTLWIVAVAWLIGKFPRRARTTVFVSAIVLMAIVGTAGYYAGVQDTGLTVLGKDTTLTGRTFLWSQGLQLGLQHFWTGYAYGDFWIPGRPEAEALWYKFDISARAGFHFHNIFVNTFVELGIVGLLLVIYLYAATCLASFRFLRERGTRLDTLFYIGIAFLFLLRGLTEIDTNGPFGLSPLLFFGILPAIYRTNAAAPLPAAPPPPVRIGLNRDQPVKALP